MSRFALSLLLLLPSLMGACGDPPSPPPGAAAAAALQAPESAGEPLAQGPAHPPALEPAFIEEVITPEALMETVEFLASPALEGRLSGSEGYREAASWAAARMKALGLEPLGDGDYLQRLRLELNEIERCQLELPEFGGEPLVQGVDWSCRGFTGSGRLQAPVVFVGYGISEPERGYDDYAGVDVRGRIVLAFKQPPPWALDEQGWGEAHMPRAKAQTAVQHGALGLLLVARPDVQWNPQPIGSVMHGPGEQPRGVPQLEIAPRVAAWLLEGLDTDLAGLQARIDGARAPASQALERLVRLDVQAWYEPEAPSANVVGLLRGADPSLRDEVVVIGAHLDHVGRQGELLYPGANDNASGSAGVLAVAEALARSPQPPARSVMFALYTAEESGLLGATHMVAHPPLPLERVVAALNMDCIGHGSGTLKLGGGGASPQLWALARGLDERGITVEETWYGGGADLQPWFEAGLPTLYFATEDSYTHLHKPGDTPDTVDPVLLSEVVRLAARTTAAIAAGGYRREARVPRQD
jgi:aminopeptidase YwaD